MAWRLKVPTFHKPMRVCITHLRHAQRGGAERYLNYLAKGLCLRGHEVTVLCRTHGSPPHPNVKFETLRGLSLGSGFRHASFARASARYLSRYED
ncbi:MAG: hypothetical protein CMN28_02195 [Salinisphaeraceae bacterium]|nr:hypothetical protein [Salinisphaeraceae bacterium]